MMERRSPMPCATQERLWKMVDPWTMYDTIMRQAEKDGELSKKQWAKMMRDRQKRPGGIDGIMDILKGFGAE